MWILRSIKSGVSHTLLPNKEYTVGRKDTSILLENDPSISRKHAILFVEHLETTLLDLANRPSLKLRDSGSKYGTYKNSLKNKIGNEEILDEGDTIIFGQFESRFRVCFEPLVVTTSCIDSDKKKELKGVLKQLGGYLVSEWRPSCTHLVMTDIKITIKAVCCLVSLKPVVTVEYFTALVESLQSETAQPAASRYIPPVGEPLIDKEKASFDVVSERKQLFENKTFAFLDKKQFKKMNFAITLGGGKAVLIEDKEAPLDFFLQPGTCVVQPSAENQKGSQPSYVAEISTVLKRKERRMIPESDFGLAVAYCSIEKFCNPDFSITSTLFSSSRIVSQTLSQCEVYVADTQSTIESPEKNILEKMSTIEETAEVKQNTSLRSLDGKESDAHMQTKENLSYGENKTVKIRDREDSDDESKLTYKRIKTEKVTQNISLETQIKNKDNLKLKSDESFVKLRSPVKLEPPSPMQIEIEKNNREEIDKCIDSLNSSFNQPDLFSTGESSKAASLFKQPKMLETSDNIQFSKSEKQSNKSKSEVPNRKLHGFLNTREITERPSPEEKENTTDDDLPRNLVKVLVADLICRKVNRSLNITANKSKSVDITVKNFKRFKKVLPVGARALPQIIGGHELEPYTKHSTKAIDDWLNENFDTQPEDGGGEDDCGEFDWESQRSRKRKR